MQFKYTVSEYNDVSQLVNYPLNTINHDFKHQ